MSRRERLRLSLQRRLARPAARWLEHPLIQGAPPRLQALLLGARLHDSLARNDDSLALADLRTLASRHGRDDLLHRLLFRRGFRPKDPASQRRLFWGVADEPAFAERHREYALVSLAYRSLKDGDQQEAGRLIPRITAIAERLEQDPGTLTCQQKNRVNRSKLLISTYATLLHLHLLRGEQEAVAAIGGRGLALAERIDYGRLPADVAYRLTTNFARVLGIAALDGWRRGDPQAGARALAALEALRQEAWSARHQGSGAQENHRTFVQALIEALQALEQQPPSPGRPAALAPERILNVRTPLLEERLMAFLTP